MSRKKTNKRANKTEGYLDQKTLIKNYNYGPEENYSNKPIKKEIISEHCYKIAETKATYSKHDVRNASPTFKPPIKPSPIKK